MNRLLKLSAAAAALAFTLTFVSCSEKPAEKASSASKASASSSAVSKASSQKGLYLPVMLAKSLNPLTTNSFINFTLWPLMYDCLAEPDKNYNPSMDLASSISIKGTIVTVTLKSAVFSDGSALTARDVCNSYETVMSTPSSYFYSNTLNIASVYNRNSQTVIFNLKSPDPLIANLLNIPIIKTGTDSLNNNYATTGVNVPPTGSGRYVFSSDSYNGTLTANKSWYRGSVSGFGQISLLNLYNSSAALSSLKIGRISYLFTDYGNGLPSTVGLSTYNVNLNRLVFMGVNSQKPGLNDAGIRSCLSLALDRKSIVSGVFSSRASGTFLPFNPDWSQLTKPAGSRLSPNFTQVQQKLSESGFNVQDSNGALTGSLNGQTITLSYKLLVDGSDTLLVSTANEIASDLKKIGVIITVSAETSAAYSTDLSSGNYDLYLGQITIPDNMDISQLITPGAPVAWGVTQQSSSATLAAYGAWRAGTGKIQSVADSFDKETPFIPICYRYGSVSGVKDLKGIVSPSYYDLFPNIGSWSFS